MTLSLVMVSASLPSDSIFTAQGQTNKVYIPLNSSENVDKHQNTDITHISYQHLTPCPPAPSCVCICLCVFYQNSDYTYT